MPEQRRLATIRLTPALGDDPVYAGIAAASTVSSGTLDMAVMLFGQVRSTLGNDPQRPSYLVQFRRLLRALSRDAERLPAEYAAQIIPSLEEHREPIRALNRALLAMHLARRVGLARYKADIGLAGLVADIGKWVRARDPDADGEDAADDVQTTLELLTPTSNWSAITKVAISQHHERMGGSGYPRGLRSAEIHPAARILGLCDVYSELFMERRNGGLYSPVEALEYVAGAGGSEFEFDLVANFLKIVVPYPVGALIVLSTGEQGVVSRFLPNRKTRPTVRVFANAKGERVSLYEVDLSLRERWATTIL